MRILIILLLPLITFSQGKIIWQENAEGKWFDNSFAKMQAASSYSITASTAQHYSGVKSIRFELRNTDKEVQSGTRAELVLPIVTSLNQWYSFALFAPSDSYKKDASDEVITQWHQGDGKTPALCLRVKSDKLYVRILGKTWVELGAWDKDSWHTYVMHIKHSSGKDGLIEIWKDGKQILNRSGDNMYTVGSKSKMPNLKLGIYKSDWNGSGTTSTKMRVLFFDDIKIGNEKATLAQMMPIR